MGSTLSLSISAMIARCRKRATQESPTHTGDHIILSIDTLQLSLDKRIHEVEQRQHQYQQQAHQYVQHQFHPYHVKLQDSIQQIELIKDRLHILEENQKSLLDNQVIAISP